MIAQVVSFNCLLKSKTGKIISSTTNREILTSTLDGSNQILIGLAKGLQNLSKGEKRSISLAAEDAYGFYEPSKVILYPKKKLPQNINIGQIISIASKTGQVLSYKVLEFYDTLVSLDGNHPLAGQDLIFEIETLDAREATIDEIAQASKIHAHHILH